jgi:rSAM/selenodomain-associated transferase 1
MQQYYKSHGIIPSKKKQLIIFTRYPQAGTTKTRMVSLLGETGSANLQRQMTEYMVNIARNLLEISDIDLKIYFAGSDAEKMQDWLGADLSYQQQAEGDLGDRMKQAFEVAFAQKMERVVMIGVDCPDITEKLLLNAFNSLKTHQIVLGPAVDGGYYLIGCSQFHGELFGEIAWGTGEVFLKTCQIAEKMGLSTAFIEILADIDRPEDYSIWLKRRPL